MLAPPHCCAVQEQRSRMATLSALDSGNDVVAEGERVNEATVTEKTEKAKCQRHPLRCSMCLDDFKEPKLLSCCHTFCKGCLERILEKSKEKKQLTCPQCRVEHEIPVGGVGAFVTDFTVAEDDRSTSRNKRRRTMSCEECDSTETAVAYCSDCRSYLCETCTSDTHKKLKSLRSHRVTLLDESTPMEGQEEKPTTLYCPLHPEEPLKVYCLSCHKLVCCYCIIASHQGHEYGSTDEMTCTTVQTEIAELAEEAESLLKTFNGGVEYIAEVEKATAAQHGQLKSTINESFDLAIALLESRRKQLLQEADGKCEAALKEVWANKDYAEHVALGLENTVGFAERIQQCSGKVEMLSLCSQAIPRLQELNASSLDLLNIATIDCKSHQFSPQLTCEELEDTGILDEDTKIQLLVSGLPETAVLALGEDVQLHIVPYYNGTKNPIPLDLLQRILSSESEDLEVKVTYGKQQRKLPVQVDTETHGWTASFTVVCGGTHTISVNYEDISAEESPFVLNITGEPQVGARVRRGPDSSCYQSYRRGTIIENLHPGYVLVAWDDQRSASKCSWGRPNDRYTVELNLSTKPRSSRAADRRVLVKNDSAKSYQN